MRPILILSLLALSLPGAAAHAQDGADATEARAPRAGEVVRDSRARVLGRVHKVQPDGTTLVIVGGRVVPLPASTLSVQNGKLVTTLTKGEALQQK
ncbi:MAG: hypothetical protein CVT74_09535 [Alphaproteobacteria bacterium HGW-Alphaproteobacteria-13]|jgi:hypothetical protein|nr:MAG: hypothetical protein CVT74_09535 [Alphaproteobacteria bacterium HGW-Alphaproteobacteria-13]